MYPADCEYWEKQSLAWRTGPHSIFGASESVRIDLRPHCVRRVLGLWLNICDPGYEEAGCSSALAFRDELLAKDWPDSERIAARLGMPSKDVAEYVHRLQTDGIIFGVWNEPRRRYVYPDFQFDHEGHALPDIANAARDSSGPRHKKRWMGSRVVVLRVVPAARWCETGRRLCGRSEACDRRSDRPVQKTEGGCMVTRAKRLRLWGKRRKNGRLAF